MMTFILIIVLDDATTSAPAAATTPDLASQRFSKGPPNFDYNVKPKSTILKLIASHNIPEMPARTGEERGCRTAWPGSTTYIRSDRPSAFNTHAICEIFGATTSEECQNKDKSAANAARRRDGRKEEGESPSEKEGEGKGRLER